MSMKTGRHIQNALSDMEKNVSFGTKTVCVYHLCKWHGCSSLAEASIPLQPTNAKEKSVEKLGYNFVAA